MSMNRANEDENTLKNSLIKLVEQKQFGEAFRVLHVLRGLSAKTELEKSISLDKAPHLAEIINNTDLTITLEYTNSNKLKLNGVKVVSVPLADNKPYPLRTIEESQYDLSPKTKNTFFNLPIATLFPSFTGESGLINLRFKRKPIIGVRRFGLFLALSVGSGTYNEKSLLKEVVISDQKITSLDTYSSNQPLGLELADDGYYSLEIKPDIVCIFRKIDKPNDINLATWAPARIESFTESTLANGKSTAVLLFDKIVTEEFFATFCSQLQDHEILKRVAAFKKSEEGPQFIMINIYSSMKQLELEKIINEINTKLSKEE